ncbi:septal ring lytic transglycosylase RlpA family protein [Geofilum sp. OHC36d9]|uniref:septal ring lytic transglycosylase RlpA family protein n=1 Tax=Geofilum sp. OHC36d9 TaxID=3458413 RepID=UPI0040345B67
MKREVLILKNSWFRNCFFLVFLFHSVFVLAQNEYEATGIASYYADKFDGRQTASGEIYRHSKLTAAHRSLPFGTLLKVINTANGKSVVVRVNDRGPFVDNRILDLSQSAALEIDAVKDGLVEVRIQQVADESGADKERPTNDCYRIDVSSVTISGYGVQIGSFSQMENLIRLADEVKAVLDNDIYVMVATVNGMIVNRLIVGLERVKHKAEGNRDQLRAQFPNCFVVQL